MEEDRVAKSIHLGNGPDLSRYLHFNGESVSASSLSVATLRSPGVTRPLKQWVGVGG